MRDGKPVAPSGIPFMLVRPEYSLTRVPPREGEKKPTYAMTVSYETDPAQVYTLKVKPGIFADVNFTMKLGTGGTLQGTTATLTEQLTPMITALGSFSKDLAGVLATADQDSVRAGILEEIQNIKDPNCPSKSECYMSCQKNSDISVSPVADIDSKPRTVAQVMVDRIRKFENGEEFVSLFHYVTEKEKICLTKKLENFIEKNKTIREELSKPWRTNLENDRKKYTNSIYQPLIDQLDKAFNSNDKEIALNKVKHEIEELKQSQAKADLLALYENALGAVRAEVSGKEMEKQIKFFLDMDRPTWLARHLLYLEREINNVELTRIRRPDIAKNTDVPRYLESLQHQRAITLGVEYQYERSLALSRFIQTIRQKAVHGGTAPATTEYVAVRTELDGVLAQIDARRTRVLGDAKPPSVQALNNVRVQPVTQEDIDKSRASEEWTNGEGKKAPDYVLLLKEIK